MGDWSIERWKREVRTGANWPHSTVYLPGSSSQRLLILKYVLTQLQELNTPGERYPLVQWIGSWVDPELPLDWFPPPERSPTALHLQVCRGTREEGGSRSAIVISMDGGYTKEEVHDYSALEFLKLIGWRSYNDD